MIFSNLENFAINTAIHFRAIPALQKDPLCPFVASARVLIPSSVNLPVYFLSLHGLVFSGRFMCYVFLCDWLLSSSVMFSRFIHLTALCSFLGPNDSLPYGYTTFCLSIAGYVGCFHFQLLSVMLL